MKSLLYTAIAASLLAIPVVSSAQQSNGPVTRAQVRAELIQLEKAGYNPGIRDPNYPEDIQAAQARVAAAQAQTSSYGPSVNGTSQSGQPPGQ